MSRHHELRADVKHYSWDSSLSPRLEIDPGDTVVFEVRDASDGEVTSATTAEQYGRRVFTGHALTGPVFVKGAQPGDALVVEIVDVQVGDHGWTGFRPGRGLLPDDFTAPHLHVWDLKRRDLGSVEFAPGIAIPVEPFCGIMGVGLAEPGQHSTMPPRHNGGNMDIKQLTAGSTLYLPIWVGGALFSVGDCHAAQGDGEVCLTAIETTGVATLRLGLRKGARLKAPRFTTVQQASPRAGAHGYFVTTAHGPDLHEVARDAVRTMIAELVSTRGLTREDAYILCSVAVDLKISEIVDAPNWIVSAFLPNAIFRA